MSVSLLEEKNVAAFEDEEHMMILASLAALYGERNSKPRPGSVTCQQRFVVVRSLL
jgi:hypothetical protein